MDRKKILHIDLETYSEAPIQKTGAYRYVDDPTFEILLLGYAIDNEDPVVLDLASGDEVPGWLLGALVSDEYTKIAHNAQFEYACLQKFTGGRLVARQWLCSAFMARYAGYPGSLEQAGLAVGVLQSKAKLTDGKFLIRYFCQPVKPTKKNEYRTRNYPKDDPKRWARFVEYNARDVEAEREIVRLTSKFSPPAWLWEQFWTDLEINYRGVAIDLELMHGALAIAGREQEALLAEAKRLTHAQNPNSIVQTLTSLRTFYKLELPDLTKDTVAKALQRDDIKPRARRILEIRRELGKTSTKKYNAMETCVCHDGRVRGLLQFYGANRTGRFSGKLVQIQNLHRTHLASIEYARELVKEERGDVLRLMYGSLYDTLAQLIRTAFVPSPGHVFIDADFSAIEARVLAWLSGEEWVLQAFRDGKDLYCATASAMFGVPVEKHGKNADLRQKGKVAVLACGFGGGVGALTAMGALDMGIKEEELPGIVEQWRTANSHTKQLWYDMQEAIDNAVYHGIPGSVARGRITVGLEYNPDICENYLTIQLPSGRKLYYPHPRQTTNRFGNPSICYMGVDQTTKAWKPIETYGAKVVENITQAVARDLLAEAIERLEKAGLPVVFHVHDEVVIDAERFGTDKEMLDKVCSIMAEVPDWAKGLPLGADGWVGTFFTKD